MTEYTYDYCKKLTEDYAEWHRQFKLGKAEISNTETFIETQYPEVGSEKFIDVFNSWTFFDMYCAEHNLPRITCAYFFFIKLNHY
jgi:hypothetical protein